MMTNQPLFIPSPGMTLDQTNSLTQGLQGFWPLWGDSYDYSGNNGYGKPYTVPLSYSRMSDGVTGCAFNISENSAKFQAIITKTPVQINSNMSFSMCLKFMSYPSTQTDNGLAFYTNEHSGGTNLFQVGFMISNSGINVNIGNSGIGGFRNNISSSIVEKTLYSAVLLNKYSNSKDKVTSSLYLNGSLINSTSLTYSTSTLSTYFSNVRQTFFIGGEYNDWDRRFVGMLRDARYYNRLLTTAEITRYSNEDPATLFQPPAYLNGQLYRHFRQQEGQLIDS
jgi:hypothetical protein